MRNPDNWNKLPTNEQIEASNITNARKDELQTLRQAIISKQYNPAGFEQAMEQVKDVLLRENVREFLITK